MDETVWTFNKFEREHQISGIAWSDARYNFTNCLGEISQLQLEKVCNKHVADTGADYPATEEGFKLMIRSIFENSARMKMPREPSRERFSMDIGRSQLIRTSLIIMFMFSVC